MERKIVILQNKNDINLLNDLKVNIAYPLNHFCVGFKTFFNIDEIQDGYIFINRILDTDSYYKLKELLSKINKNVKGIIFDDLGIIELIKDLKVEKILYNNHFCTNYESINYFLEYVDSLVISTDITKAEIIEILKQTNKPLTIYGFGLTNIMYSRRYLLSNYEKHYNLKEKKELKLSVNDERFISIENEYGTIFYSYPYFNALDLEKEKNIKYILINSLLVPSDELKNILTNHETNLETNDGFLNKKTIYKLKEEEK